jgi:hypothetical protein
LQLSCRRNEDRLAESYDQHAHLSVVSAVVDVPSAPTVDHRADRTDEGTCSGTNEPQQPVPYRQRRPRREMERGRRSRMSAQSGLGEGCSSISGPRSVAALSAWCGLVRYAWGGEAGRTIISHACQVVESQSAACCKWAQWFKLYEARQVRGVGGSRTEAEHAGRQAGV